MVEADSLNIHARTHRDTDLATGATHSNYGRTITIEGQNAVGGKQSLMAKRAKHSANLIVCVCSRDACIAGMHYATRIFSDALPVDWFFVVTFLSGASERAKRCGWAPTEVEQVSKQRKQNVRAVLHR